jgi:hypothetical protein
MTRVPRYLAARYLAARYLAVCYSPEYEWRPWNQSEPE